MSTPEHIAIILDGNGRWAKSKGMPRNYGHTVGAKNVENICKAANDLGVKYLTLYAFSTENWNRPESEVAALMKLLESYLKNCIKTANKNNMRVRVIGEISRLSENFQEKIRNLEEVSSVNTGLNLTIAINYGSRDEMIRAVKHMIADHDDGKLSADDIDADTFSSYLDTRELRILIYSSAQVVSSACQTTCSGSLHTLSFILQMFRGLHLIKMNSKRL